MLISLPALCADRATFNYLVRELATSYLGKFDENLSKEPLQYADFSEWQNQILEAEETKIGENIGNSKTSLLLTLSSFLLKSISLKTNISTQISKFNHYPGTGS